MVDASDPEGRGPEGRPSGRITGGMEPSTRTTTLRVARTASDQRAAAIASTAMSANGAVPKVPRSWSR